MSEPQTLRQPLDQDLYDVDIDSKLSKIDGDMNWIKAFHEDFELAGLRTDAGRLTEMARVLAHARIEPQEITCLAYEVEGIDRDVQRISERLLLSLERTTAKIDGQEWNKSLLSPSDEISDAKRAVFEVVDDTRKVAFAVRVRLLANGIRSGLGLASALGSERQRSLGNALDRARERVEGVLRLVHDKAPQLKAKLQKTSTDESQQRELIRNAEDALAPVQQELVELGMWLDQLQRESRNAAERRNEPLLVELTIDQEGNVLSARHSWSSPPITSLPEEPTMGGQAPHS